jgi:putative oxidoreductase
LIARVLLGHGFALTGFGKLSNFDRTVAFFDSLGLPLPALNAGLVGGLELLGGVALVLGFLTRPFAAALASTLVVALLTNDLKAVVSSGAPLTVAAAVFLLLSVLVFAYGAGPLSVDSKLARRRLAA